MKHNTNKIDSVLGQKVDSPTLYTPSILVREARQTNRTPLGIRDEALPFVGYDVWNGYECSVMTDKMRPITCIAKVVYPCDSKYIVESKSMKLYWNSFNMQPWGANTKEALKNLKLTATNDLSMLLECDVKVELFSQEFSPDHRDNDNESEWRMDCGIYDNLERLNTTKHVNFTVFNETPSILKVVDSGVPDNEYFYSTTLLRSNCKITHQPDSGDLYIYYKGDKTVTEASLLEWIVSFRNECHFHEEILEVVYTRLFTLLKPTELLVTAYYARRGGWDINPTRASHKHLLNKDLINHKKPFYKQPKQ